MSVRPVSFNPDGTITLVSDETGHTGNVAATAVDFLHRADGSRDPSYLVLNCPDNCGTVSLHPVGGGAAPAQVQELFTRTMARLGCPCSTPIPGGRPIIVAQAHAKMHAERMDGAGRWAVVGTLT